MFSVCEPPDLPEAGTFNISEDGLHVSVTCDNGYTLDGMSDFSCDINGGGWIIQNNSFPNCCKVESVIVKLVHHLNKVKFSYIFKQNNYNVPMY